MRRSISAVMVVLVLVLAIVGCAKQAASTPVPEKKTVSIIDERGKQFEVPQPLERVGIFNTFNIELVRAIGGWQSVIGMDANAAQDKAYWPGFDANNIIGQSQSAPNYEKIVSLKPQVVIFPINGAWAEAEEKLTPFGIQVIVINGWAVEGFPARVATLGLMFGKTEKAKELIAFYQKYAGLMQERVKKVEKKKRVYYESYGIANDYKTALVGSGWNDMVVLAGGINIFGDININEQPTAKGNVHAFTVDPEAILVRKPDLVIKIEPGSQVRPGTGTSTPPNPDEMKATWERLVNRPGWDKLEAVKNDQVHVISPFPANALSKVVGALYVAKWLYPELFADVDPNAVMEEWIVKYQGVSYSKRGHVFR